jgi:hypothetical protein
MSNKNTELLGFEIGVDVKQSTRAIAAFNKAMSASLRGVGQATRKLGRQTKDADDQAAKGAVAQAKAQKARIQELKKYLRTTEDLTAADRNRLRSLVKIQREMLSDSKQSEKFRQVDVANEKKANQQKVSAIQQYQKARAKLLKSGNRNDRRYARGQAGRESEIGEHRSNLSDAKSKVFSGPASAFRSKDPRQVVDSLGDALGAAFSKRTAKSLVGLGAKHAEIGAARLAHYQKRGGVTGLAGRTAGRLGVVKGGGLKALGKGLGGITQMASTLSKFLPMLGLLGGGIMALAKAFIEADSMVKDFNRGVMESAGNLEYMAQYGSDGADRLKGSLQSLAESAHDANFNNLYGIKPETHQQAINVLTQEGVSLGELNKRADAAGQSLGQLNQGLVATGVSYSRNLGVPLQEIQQLRAQVMTQTGVSIKKMDESFATMTRTAAESGIAGNTFFQMIKGVSQDFSVWNLRMSDSVELLGQMGKVMSPKSAEKFFQTIAKGMSGMGRTDLLKHGITAGSGATKAANAETLQRFESELASTLKISVAEVSQMSSSQLAEKVSGKEYTGTDRERVTDLAELRNSMKGDQYAQSQGLKYMSPASMLKLFETEMGRFGASFNDTTSLKFGQAAENMGIDPETAKGLFGMRLHSEGYRKRKMDEAETPEEKAKYKNMTQDELINEQGKTLIPEDPIKIQQKSLNMSERQAELTQNILDKMSNLVDHYMVKFYYIMTSIKDWLVKLAGKFMISVDKGEVAGGREGKELVGLLGQKGGVSAVAKAADKSMSSYELMDAAEKAGYKGKDLSKLRSRIGSTFGSMGGSLNSLKESGGSEKILADAGLDAKKVLGQSLWSMDDGKLPTFINQLGLDSGAGSAAGLIPNSAGASPSVSASKKAVEAPLRSADTLETLSNQTQAQTRVLKDTGIKISQEGAKTVGSSMLDSLRLALYEYFMYSGSDRGRVARAFGGSPSAGALSGLTGQMAAGKGADAVLSGMAVSAKANASGGTVTGISNGLAVVAAHGEGLASVGKGERIVPAGGGTEGGLTINVNGIGGQDLARLIQGKVVEGIREYKRRERLA